MPIKHDAWPERFATRYDWETWLDGNVWELVSGVDYDVSDHSV